MMDELATINYRRDELNLLTGFNVHSIFREEPVEYGSRMTGGHHNVVRI